MADHHDLKSRTTADDIVDDDPLAELARIIGYERPQTPRADVARVDAPRAEIAAPQTVPDADIFDLEAELMRELDVSGEAVEPEPFAAAVEPVQVEPAFEPGPTLEVGPVANAGSDDADAQWASLDAAPIDASLDTDAVEAETVAEDDFSAEFEDLIVEDLLDEELAIDADLPLDAGEAAMPAEAAYAAPDRFVEAPTEIEPEPQGDDASTEEPAAAVETDIFDALIDWPEDEWQAAVETPAAEAASAEPAMAALEAMAPVAAAAAVARPLATPPARNPDQDDILADISRFELPSHNQTPEPEAAVQPVAAFVAEAPVAVEAHAVHMDVSGTQAPADHADEPVLAIEPDYAPMVEDAPVSAPAYAPEPEPSTHRMAMPDFEDELSAELDIYRHEIEIAAVAEDEAIDDVIADADGNAYFDEAARDFVSGGEETGSDDPRDSDFDAELGSALAHAFDDMPAVAAGAAAVEPDRYAVQNAHAQDAPRAEPVFDEPRSPCYSHAEAAAPRPGDDSMAAAFLDLAPSADDARSAPADPVWPDDLALADDLANLDAAARHHGADASDVVQHAEAGDEPALDDADWLDVMDRSEPAATVRAPSASGLAVPPSGVAAASVAAIRAVAPATASFPGHGAGRRAEQAAPRDMGADAFDLSAITETSSGLDVVRHLDVPAVPHAAEPDLIAGSAFEDDIEREFADLVEQETRDLHVPSAVDWQARSGDDARPTGPDFDHLEDALEADLNAQVETTEMAYRPRPVPVDADQALKAARDQSVREESKRAPVIAGAVLGVAVLFGGVAFGWSYLSGGSDAPDGGPRIIRADKEPVKVAPENPGGLSVPNQDKAVYDRVAGTDAAGATQPKLVTTAEEPVDVVQRTLDPDVLPLEGRDDGDVGSKAEERLTEAAAGDAASEGSAAPAEPIVSPRKVRTMIVRPDGTIVAREEPVTEPATPAQAAPAETPVAPLPAALAPATTDLAAPVAETAPAELRPAIEAAATPQAPAATEAQDAPLAPVRVVKTTQITPDGANAPVPAARPADQPVNVVSTVTETGRVTEGAAAAPANPGGYFMQIASQPSPEGAQASYQSLSNRYANIIGGRGVDIQRAEIEGRGVFHRVRIPAGDRAAANALCAQYKAAGGSCIVTR